MVGDPDPTRAREAAMVWPGLECASNTDETDGNTESEGQTDGAHLERLHLPVGRPPPFGENQHRFAGLQKANDRTHGLGVGLINVDRKGPEPANQTTQPGDSEEPLPGQIVDRPAERNRNQDRVGVRDMVGKKQERPRARDMLDPLEADLEIELGESPDEGPSEL